MCALMRRYHLFDKKRVLILFLCLFPAWAGMSCSSGGAGSDKSEGAVVIVTNKSDASFVLEGPSGSFKSEDHPLDPDHTLTIDNLKAGVYTLSFYDIDGCQTPPSQATGTLEKDQVLTLSGNYSECGAGTIKVYTNHDNASFTITGPDTFNGNAKNWETTVAPEGSYTITFDSMDTYSTPSTITKTLTGGQVVIFTGNYTSDTTPAAAGEIEFTSNHPEAVFFITGPVFMVGTGTNYQLEEVPTGDYTVTFEDIEGYDTPASYTITVTEDQTADVETIYVKEGTNIEPGPDSEPDSDPIDPSNFYFYDGFENGLNSSKWDAGAEWDLTGEISRAGSYSFTDSPEGDYPNNANTTAMTAGFIDLSKAAEPVLKFWYISSLFDSYSDCDDGIYVEISEDGGFNWTLIWSQCDVTFSSWTPVIIDLSGYKSEKIKIRFRLRTSSSYQADGWYIDDVEISELNTVSTLPFPFYDSFENGLIHWEVANSILSTVINENN